MKKLDEIDEKELIALAQNNDSEAVDFLLDKYKNLVLKLSRRLFLLDGEKDDLIQEGMIGLFKAINGYDSNSEVGFAKYAQNCINNQMISAVRKSSTLKNKPLNDYVSLDASSEDGDSYNEKILALGINFQNPEDIIIGNDEVDRIKDLAYLRLSSMEKKVLDLYLSGLNYDEIAGSIGKSKKSIDNCLQRIRNKMQDLL